MRVKHQSAASCMLPTRIKPTNQACIALNKIDRYLWGLHFSERKKISKIHCMSDVLEQGKMKYR